MATINVADAELMLGDPLKEVTRRERRSLLGVSTLGVFIAISDAVPRRISALDIEFDAPQQDLMRGLFAMVIAYFLLTFLLYGLSDLLVYRAKFIALLEKAADDSANEGPPNAEENFYFAERDERRASVLKNGLLPIPFLGPERMFVVSSATGRLRSLFEFGFPILFGVYASVILLQ